MYLIAALEGGNQAAFARRIGVRSGVVGDMIGQRQNKPSFDVMAKIVAGYPQLRVEWLLLGEGSAFKDGVDPPHLLPNGKPLITAPETTPEVPHKEYGKGPQILTVQVGPDNEENIELVSVRAAAGYAAGGLHERHFIKELPSFRLPDAAYRNGTFRAFQVSGDSMMSTLYPGDWVICRYIEHWDRDIRDMYVHVVVTEETVLVKRVNNRLNEHGELALHSDNPAYPIQFMDGEHVREVWVAVGKLSRQFVNPRFNVNMELARLSESVQELLAWKNRSEGNLNS